MPTTRLPRTASSQTLRHVTSMSRLNPGRAQSPATLSAFFGDSWSAIQGMASDLLTPSQASSKPTLSPRRRKPSINSANTRNTSAPSKQWGVPTTTSSSTIGLGSQEERDSLIRAEKRKQLMNATPEHNSVGHFKRRSSEDGPSASAPPEHGHDRDALVYVHHVRPEDTLAGITIKYNIHPSALRRANRMWPNDRIQVRKTILLPVDQCAVKGTRLNGSEDLYQLTQENNPFPTSIEEVKAPVPTGRKRTESVSTNGDRPSSSSCRSSHDPEATWEHDAWVLLPNSKQPTEIARSSRRNLAFFPPARRKSQSYSDIDTPSASLDLNRSVIHENPLDSPKQEVPQRPRGTRRSSNANNAYFPSYLAGPGGVGTMAKNVKSPGPAQDGLNKMFASHLPNVAPPPNQSNLYLPDIPTYSDDPTPFTAGLTHAQSPSINIENVGAAVEGWMRKMAAKASTAIPPPQDRGVANKGGPSGIGDLIEMAESFEIGEDEEDEEQQRGRQGSENNGRPGMSSSASFAYASTLKDRARSGTSAGAGKRQKDD
jgi:LysM repeat protein